MEVSTLRELLRNLQSWESLYEASEVPEVITGPDGTEYSIFDIQYVYSCRNKLAPRQQEAIELFLYENIKEKEVARMMGVSETNPVAMYATDGLKRLCGMIVEGELFRYQEFVVKNS